VFRRITVAIASGAMLAFGALPAAAATGGPHTYGPHTFSVPGVHGISAWGSYQRLGAKVRVTVCVRVSSRDIYGGAAAGVAYSGRHHQSVAAVAVGYQHTACQSMSTGYTAHLIVDALSGYRNGKVRQAGKIRQIY
jgi:ABC-type Co2+ transport system permease subunit